MHSLNPHLVFTRDSRERKQALSSFGVTIGRSKECDLQIDDRRISMQHCRLFFNNGEWCVADLKSANRTFVNDELVLERLVWTLTGRASAWDSGLTAIRREQER